MDARRRKGSARADYTPWLVLLPIVACFAAIQLGTDRFGGNDGYYHVKYAWLLWHEGAIWDFEWLRGTFFHENWVDSEFLYHVFLIPFTLPGDLYLAGKVAPVVFGSLGMFSVYWVIRSFGEPGSDWRKHSWFAVVVMVAASSVLLYRFSMPRVPATSVTFMMLGIVLLERRAPKWLAVLGFFYAWMYPVSVVLIPLALFHSAGRWYDEDQFDLRPVAAVAGGIVAGFIINPYFPGTLPLLFNHVVEIGIGTSSIPKGNEWAPYDSWYLFTNAQVAWTALFLGGLSMIGIRARGRHLFYLACTAMMMLAYFKSRRFVEYWPLFAILFSASTFHEALRTPESLVGRLRKRLGANGEWVISVLVVAIVLGIAIKNVRRAIRDVASNAMPTRLAGAAEWLRDNTPENTQVYNVEWDIFPELIFYNHQNHWTLGLDPNFTYEVAPHLYHLSVAIGQGSVREPGRYIEQYFGAKYALITNKKAPFINRAKQTTSGLKKVFSDEHASIFRVVPGGRFRTLEPELEPFKTDLPPSVGVCKHHAEAATTPNARWVYLRCRQREPTPFSLRYTVNLPVAAEYNVATRIMTGAAPGRAEILVNGKRIGPAINLAHEERSIKGGMPLGRHRLPAGDVSVEIRFAPERPDKPVLTPRGKPSKWQIEVGIDSIVFNQVDPS